MIEVEQNNEGDDATAVDDVRRIRERLDRESQGDIQKHIQQSNRVLEEYRQRLGLKLPQPMQKVGHT